MTGEIVGETGFGTSTEVSDTFSNTGIFMSSLTDCARSVLSADVTGGAKLHEKLGHAEAQRAVDRCLKRMERSVDAYRGRIIKAVGNELMAFFDFPDEALQAAIDMQQKVANLPPVSGLKLEIRVGFSHGPTSFEEGELVGDAVGLAAYLAGLARPGQVLTCSKSRETLSAEFLPSTHSLGPFDGTGRYALTSVFSVDIPGMPPPLPVVPPHIEETKQPTPPAAKKSQPKVCNRLMLRYAGTAIVMDPRKPLFNLGRDAECEVVIAGRKVSRKHARIEWRKDAFFLIDQSTNGTFVALGGESETALHRQECVLYGKGVIGLAGSVDQPDSDRVEFELLDAP